jgi:methylenetetrahydrofolate dehydrogenase (NADP+) / methenyltetrahydrofolate cyclohydrolase
MIFDGKAFARKIEEQLIYRVRNLIKKPRIVSILVGDDPASALYTRLKKQAAERVGIAFEVVYTTKDALVQTIAEASDRSDGVMLQLPIPGLQGQALKEVLLAIPLEKDVDGLRWEESKIMPATVRGILSLIDEIARDKTKFAVLGSRGSVGRPLVHFLKQRGAVVSEIELDTPEPTRSLLEGEVVISCVGKAGLVTADMINSISIAIDVGMSQVDGKVVGDMTQEVYQKASIAVPVPGGVGPVTIASLMANAVEIYG